MNKEVKNYLRVQRKLVVLEYAKIFGYSNIMGMSYLFLGEYKKSSIVFDRYDYYLDFVGAGNI